MAVTVNFRRFPGARAIDQLRFRDGTDCAHAAFLC
jgi:hypothetical protein